MSKLRPVPLQFRDPAQPGNPAYLRDAAQPRRAADRRKSLRLLSALALCLHLVSAGSNCFAAVTVVSEASGDLNGDGRADEAKILQDGQSSTLVISFRGAEDKLKKVTESATATMLPQGPSGGQPSVEINKGVLLVEHYCGARQRYEFTHKYQWRKGQWLLIGYTGSTNDANTPDSAQRVDINFVTGEVATSFINGSKKRSERFLEIRAPHIVATQPAITDWSVPRIVLRPLTKTAPALATQAVANDKQLFIKVQYDPPGKDAPREMFLQTADNKMLQPIKVKTSPYGYTIGSFDLSAPEMQAATAKVTDWSSEKPYQVLRLSLVVPGEKASAGGARGGSGGRGGSVRAGATSTARPDVGAILLSDSHEPLTLKDIDVQNQPLPHPFIYELPN